MGCLISYATRDGLLRADVWGKATFRDAVWVARGIVEHAQPLRRVLIDVRRLAGRLGKLGTLSMALGDPGEVRGYRVAIVDLPENNGYYALHEARAKGRGYALRYFSSAGEATSWLLDPGG